MQLWEDLRKWRPEGKLKDQICSHQLVIWKVKTHTHQNGNEKKKVDREAFGS